MYRFNKKLAADIANECKNFYKFEMFLDSENNLSDKIKTKLKDNLGLIRRNYEIVNVQPGFIPNIYSYTGFNEDFFDFFGADSVKYFIKDYL